MKKETRIIGLRCFGLTDAQKQKIQETAPDFTLTDITQSYTNEQLAEFEIIFGNMPPKDMQYAKNLKWYHMQSAGVERYCKPGVVLPENMIFTNSSGAYGAAIAEHLITMAMMLQHYMPRYINNMKSKEWQYLGKVKSIYGSKVTVAGFGDIGSHFARKMHALGAGVKGIVRVKRQECPSYLDGLYTSSDIEQTNKALSEADIVALCMPETPETINFLSRERIKSLKQGVIILNIGRGSAIDQKALEDYIENGHIGGAGLDVTSPEPLPADSVLWTLPNVIITPHVSGRDSLDSIHELIVGKFLRYLDDYINGRPFDDVVDKTAWY